MNRRNVHIIAAATLFGSIVWLTVTLREQYQVSVDVPIDLEGIPEGYAVRTPVPQTVQLKLRGDGWRLATVFLGPDLHLRPSAPAFPQSKHLLLLNEAFDRLALRPGIQIAGIAPESLTVELDRSASKKVPVELDCSFTFGNMFGSVGQTVVSPESVSVSGAESVLRNIASWKTEHRNFDNLQSPIDLDIPLVQSAPYIITVSPPAVSIHVRVERFVEKVFPEIPVEVRAVPPDRKVLLVPPKIEVVVRAGLPQLTALADIDVRASVDYSMILADTSGTVEPDVSTPPGVQVLRRTPDRLTYIIRKPL